MKRVVRVICPSCHEEVSARPDWRREPHLVVEKHERGRGFAQRACLGAGRRVGPEAMPPRPRPISYEETVRLIDALLGESA